MKRSLFSCQKKIRIKCAKVSPPSTFKKIKLIPQGLLRIQGCLWNSPHLKLSGKPSFQKNMLSTDDSNKFIISIIHSNLAYRMTHCCDVITSHHFPNSCGTCRKVEACTGFLQKLNVTPHHCYLLKCLKGVNNGQPD